MGFEYEPPRLTKYGRIADFVQAGSVPIAFGDVTGDGVSDTLFDTNGDGEGDIVVGGANGGQTPVTQDGTLAGFTEFVYDADGDGNGGIEDNFGTLSRVTSNEIDNALEMRYELAEDDGWDEPARD